MEVVEGRRGGRTVVGRGRCVGRELGRGAERKTNRKSREICGRRGIGVVEGTAAGK